MKKCDHELENTQYYDGGYVVEEITKCKKCGAIKDHWAYGITLVKDWDEDIPIRKECGDCFYNYQCNGACATDPKACPYLKTKEEEKVND
jgi:hypothetical protein